MNQDQFYKAIGISQVAQEAIANYNLRPAEYTRQRELFLCHREEFLQQLSELFPAPSTEQPHIQNKSVTSSTTEPDLGQQQLQQSSIITPQPVSTQLKDPALFFLAFSAQFAQEVLPKRIDMGIPEQVCIDTFRDISILQEAHYKLTGKFGISRPWMCKILDMKVFRLGRLTFEPAPVKPVLKHITNPLFPTPEIPVIYTHIPADGSLNNGDCKKSYQQVAQFFGTTLPQVYANSPNNAFWVHGPTAKATATTPIVCHSWLLSPALQKLLPAKSNIIAFQQDYIIESTNAPSRQAEERIFGKVQENPAHYTAHTALQQAAKQWLMQGNTIPLGYGLLRKEILMP